ncbi:MAG: Hpt domain-containing protein [bacterium]|nr:Hpt domain-containing protein [bacterium]
MAQQDEIYIGFVDEVDSYIPVIRNGIGELRVHPDNRPVLNEIHRLVHIIRGASGMLGIGGLSQLAKSMEMALEHVQKGEMALNSAVFSALNKTVGAFEQYSRLIRAGEALDEVRLQAEVERICAHVQAIPVEPRQEEPPVVVAHTPAATLDIDIDLDEELLASFNEEADEHFDEISRSMLRLYELVDTAKPVETEVSELVRAIRRGVHTVKGASAVLGMQHIADVGHRIEDVLDWLYEAAETIEPDILEVLGRLLDQLENMVRAPGSYDAGLVDEGLAWLQERISTLPVKEGSAALFQEEDLFQQESPEDEAASSLSTSLFSEEELEMLREGFMEEADEHLQELSRSLQNLENRVEGPVSMEDQHREEVRTIRRAVHTIKGASAVIGMNDISSYAHKVEDFLDWLFEEAQEINPDTVTLLAESLDLLSAVVEEPGSVDEARRQEIFTRLLQVSQGGGASVEPPAETAVQSLVEENGAEAAALTEDILADMAEAEETLITQEPDFAFEADPLLQSSEGEDAGAFEDLFGAEPELELDHSELSEHELVVMRQVFADEAELYLENLHQGVQFLEAGVSAEVPLAQDAAEAISNMRSQVLELRKGALALGNGDVSAYARMVVDFLGWMHDDAALVSPSLVNVLGDTIDVLGRLVENPDMVSWDRVEGVCRNLDAAKEGAAGGGAEAGVPSAQDAAVQAEVADTTMPATAEEVEKPALAEQPETAAATRQVKETPASTGQGRKPSAAVPVPAASAADAAKTIRIHQSQLDSLINLANELLVGVSGFDQNMGLFETALQELDLTVRRLKDIALELETKFEVKALDQLSFHFDRIEEARKGIEIDAGFAEFDSMELDRYTQLNLIIRSLNESTIDVAAIHANMEGIHSGLGGDINRQHRVVRELQVQMMRARLSPMSMLTPRLSRTMRDVASRLNKRVRLVMEGDTVELDRVIWEKLADPFMHLVRNSVNHGVEEPKERAETGKPAIATIRISGRREGNHVVVRYSDDGRGMDLEAIRTRARRNMGAEVDRLTERQLIDLIFTPGFSTQKVVDQISGRGVGMDVVRQNVQELQGSIAVESRPGEGAQFTIRVPLTLGVVRSLLVEMDEVTYGVPLSDILDIQRMERSAIDEENQAFEHQGKVLPLYNLSLLLGRQQSDEEKTDPRPLVFITTVEGNRAGVQIPRIAGQREVVLKGLGSHLRTVTGVAGAAVMGDGSVIPLLNMVELIVAYQQVQPDIKPVEETKAKSLTVMIVDDSISIRRVMSRLVANYGWIPVEAKDGQDAFEQLDTMRPDCILLDIEMPRMNGFEFLTLKSNLPEHKDIPVIMLTSRSSDKHRHKAMELGASAFLNKPTKDEDFVDAVLRLTGHRRTGQDERQREVML